MIEVIYRTAPGRCGGRGFKRVEYPEPLWWNWPLWKLRALQRRLGRDGGVRAFLSPRDVLHLRQRVRQLEVA